MNGKPKSGITREEIIGWGGAEVFNQALSLVNSSQTVKDVAYDDETLVVSGKIEQPSGWDMPVSFRLKPGGTVESLCPCDANRRYGRICLHVAAIAIALNVLEMEDEPEPRDEGCDHPADGDAEPDGGFIEVEMRPKIHCRLYGSRASLAIEVDAEYGEIVLPACSVQAARTVYLPDPDDPLVRRTRSIRYERDALRELGQWGFHEGYSKNGQRLCTVDQQKVLNFLGAGLPAFRGRGWIIELDQPLMDLTDTMPSIVPVVTIRDAPLGSFDVSYTFDAMGHDISPIEVQAAVNRGDGYIMKDGQVVLLDNTAIAEIHNVFRDCAPTQNGAPTGWFRVKGVHAPYVKASLDSLDCDVDTSGASRWRETAQMRNRANDAKFEPVALGRLESVLRPYQKQGVYWMCFLDRAGLGGLLADEMGLGKTLQTLTWLSLIHHTSTPTPPPTPTPPSLIVCPTSLVRNWEAEARKFVPWLRVLVLSGPDRARFFRSMSDVDIVITSYALVQRDFEEAYADRRFSAVVLDEAQHIKNRQTKNAKAVKMIACDRRLVLTGTPVENSVADVWSIFDFLMPGYLGDYESFKLSYEDPIAGEGGVAEKTMARLKRKLHPFILRRLKKTVAKDLPDKIVKVSYCPMSEDAQREYTAALAEARLQAKGVIREKGFARSKFELLAILMRLRQIASRAKLEAFVEQLESAIAGGHKILVFSQFVKMLALVSDELRGRGIPFCYLDGSTKDRLGECNRFNRSPQIPVFLISLMAGGTGLNLTGADMVIHYDPWWNPAVEDQATDRAHRIGQKKTVYVVKMIASGSVEEKVLALQRRKQAVIAATVSTTDQAVMEKLTSEDLASLLS